MAHHVALALQGGGSHGAFTWGVLHRLLDEVAAGEFQISAISGASAGAVNGALCAYGLGSGDQASRTAATQALLGAFWQSLSKAAFLGGNPFSGVIAPNFLTGWNLDWNPVAIGMEIASLFFSPYNLPFFRNALEPLIREYFPPEALAQLNENSPPLFAAALNIGNNQRKVFSQPHLSVETLLASACLPHLFQAIEIDKHVYWDGGYIGNPALAPLVKRCQDIIVVMVNPMRVKGMPPRGARQILDRLNEITFNAPLVLEINAIHAVNKLLDKLGKDKAGKAAADKTGYRQVRLHFIRNDAFMEEQGFVGKANASLPFLRYLFEAGRQTADEWLAKHRGKIGAASSCSWKANGCSVEADVVDPALKGA